VLDYELTNCPTFFPESSQNSMVIDYFLTDGRHKVTEETDREAQAHTAIVFLASIENILRQWV